MTTLKPTDYETIVVTIRSTLLEACKLRSERCLNALSARGTDLSELISSSQSYSKGMGEPFMLFELLRDMNGDNYVTPGREGKMLTITAYTFHMMCYGNASDRLANEARATFKNPGIAQELRNRGIFVTGVTGGEAIHEFVNNTMLLRVDLDMTFEALSETEDPLPQEYFDESPSAESLTGLAVRSVRDV